MSRRRGPFDSRLDRLEQESDISELDEVDRNVYAIRDDEGVYRKVVVCKDEGGQKFYGWLNKDGAVQRLPVDPFIRIGPRRAKYATSGSS